MSALVFLSKRRRDVAACRNKHSIDLDPLEIIFRIATIHHRDRIRNNSKNNNVRLYISRPRVISERRAEFPIDTPRVFSVSFYFVS